MNKANVGASAGAIAILAIAVRLVDAPQREKVAPMRTEAPTVAQNPDSGATSDKTPPPEGPWLATRPFFHTEGIRQLQFQNNDPLNLSSIADLERCTADAACTNAIKKYFGVADGYKTEFLIATVPDPLHTRLALFTDASMDAIQKAAFDAQWQFATQWLPWRDSADPLEKDPIQRRTQRHAVRVQEKQPGLLIFRSTPERAATSMTGDGAETFDRTALFVFVVGETPTAGVNGNQYRAARAYMKMLADSSAQKVRILGPTFSGSFFSLAELVLQEHHGHPPHPEDYTVLSGTATNRRYASAFSKQTGVRFRGTNEDTIGKQLYFCHVLDYLGVPHDQAASLIEGETGFSKGFRFEEASTHDDDDAAAEFKDPCGSVPPRVLLFPRDISHLRNVYRDAIAASQTGNTAQQAIDFSLKDPESGEDSVPVFSSTQTPVSQYSVITELTNEIRRDRLRIVQLGATDVLDSLFLAKVLRKECPDTRLLITTPDVLFIQEAQTDSLTGTLALSSYPLFFAAKQWFGANPTTHADINSEGVYNAMRLLLARDVPLEDLSDYYWKSQRHPPSWLTTLGKNGFSPVKVIPGRSNDWFAETKAHGIPPLDLRLPPPSRVWTLAIAMLSSFSLLFAGWIIYLEYRPATMICCSVALDHDYAADSCRLFCLLAALLILPAMQAILLIPLIGNFTLRSPSEHYWGIQALGIAGFCAPLLSAFLWLGKRLWASTHSVAGNRLFKTPRDGPARKTMLALLLLFFLALLFVWTLCCYRPSPDSDSFFFSLRTLELEPGSSPALPVLTVLLGLLLLCLFHTTRFYFAGYQRPVLFTGALDRIFPGRLKRFSRKVNRVLLAPMNLSPRRQLAWAAIAALLLLAIGLLCRADINLSTVDGSLFNAFFLSLLALLIFAIAATCIQINVAWKALQSLLRSLHALPIASAFTRLSHNSGKSPIWVRHLDLRSLDIPLQSALVLHDLLIREKEPALKTDMDVWMKEYWVAVRTLLEEDKTRRICQLPVPFSKRTIPEHISFMLSWVDRDQPARGTTTELMTRSELRRAFCDLWRSGAVLSQDLCERVLIPEWRGRFLPWRTVEEPEEENSTKSPEAEVPEDPYNLAQAFVALQFSMFIVYAVRQIQNLLWSVSLGFLMLVIALSCYSFQSPQAISRFLLVAFVVIGCFTWKWMTQMERNPILSRLAGSTAGELNKDFYFKLVSYGALPVLGVLASQFPSISTFLFSWVQPTLEAFR